MDRSWIAVAAICASLAFPGSSVADVPLYGTSTVVGQVPGTTCCVSQIAIADLNGDGRQDAIFTRSLFLSADRFPVTVLLNDGQGKFVDATSSIFSGSVPLTQNPRELAIADLNGDGRPDVFIADTGDDRNPFPGFQNTLILSAPGGRLADATASLPQASDFTHSAAVADVDGGGSADLYVGNIYGQNAVPPRLLLNDGTGVLSIGAGLLPAAQTDLAQTRYTSSLFADLNEDGKPDLVLGGDTSAPSAVLLNDGTGHFTAAAGALPAKPFGPDAIALDVAALDVNHDPHTDLLIAFTKGNPFYVGRWIQVLVGKGDGTFDDETSARLPQSDNTDEWPVFFHLRDLNRDGRMDFGVQVQNAGGSPLLVADDAGAFQVGRVVKMGDHPVWAFVDALGDGSNDILAVDSYSGVVSLFPEHPAVAPPPDKSPPRLTVKVKRVHKLRQVISKGLPVTIGCSEPCSFAARLVHGGTVGRGTGKLAAAGRKQIRVRLTRRARRTFRAKRKVAVTLRTTATDEARNTSRSRKKILLRR
jgi:hypothetical protein